MNFTIFNVGKIKKIFNKTFLSTLPDHLRSCHMERAGIETSTESWQVGWQLNQPDRKHVDRKHMLQPRGGREHKTEDGWK
jgi:hypothetical protein